MSLFFGARNLMLKKEYCQKCWNAYTEFFDTEESKNMIRWNKEDEKRWEEEGVVWCPLKYLVEEELIDRRITEQPPEKCPFYLENVISNQEKILKNKKC